MALDANTHDAAAAQTEDAGDPPPKVARISSLQALPTQTLQMERLFSHGAPGGELDVERHSKALFMAIFTVCLAVLLLFAKLIPSWSAYDMLGLAMCFTITTTLVTNLAVIFSFKNLHFIRIQRRRYPNARLVFLPYSYEEDEEALIYAISWLAALRGSNIEGVFSTFLYLTFGLMFAVVALRWTEYDDFQLSRDLDILLFLAGGYGAFWGGTWNLERHDVKYSGMMHQLSVLIMSACGPLAFMVQQHWSAFSIVLGCLGIAIFGGWFVAVEVIDCKGIKYEQKDIHRMSLALLLTELAGIAFIYLAVILYTFSS